MLLAAYPDVVDYFMPPSGMLYGELTEEQREGELIYRKLIESLTEEQGTKMTQDPTEFLLYLKRFYKDELGKRFFLASE